jgi:hypothetical protein
VELLKVGVMLADQRDSSRCLSGYLLEAVQFFNFGYTRTLLRSVATHSMWIRLKISLATTLTRKAFSPGEFSYSTVIQLRERGHFAQLMFDFIS